MYWLQKSQIVLLVAITLSDFFLPQRKKSMEKRKQRNSQSVSSRTLMRSGHCFIVYNCELTTFRNKQGEI